MKAKALEVRDRNTFIPVLCVDMNPQRLYPEAGNLTAEQLVKQHSAQRYLLRRCGYPCDGPPIILMCRLDGDGKGAHNDPYNWQDRTFTVAHDYIIKQWHTLVDGDVVDVEFILGETEAPKVSERVEHPNY